jgi:hypothetical protein
MGARRRCRAGTNRNGRPSSIGTWWLYHFAVYGDLKKLKKLKNALPNLTYETELGEQLKVFINVIDIEYHCGFLAVHANRNYGGSAPLEGLCEISPQLTFGGMFHNQIRPDIHWSWEIRNGLLTVEEHVDDDFDWEGREITPDEIKGEIKKLTAKIETLTRKLAEWKSYLVRRHRGQIGDALTEEEAKEIGEIVDAERPRSLAWPNDF